MPHASDKGAEGAGPQSDHRPRLHIGAAYYPEHWPEERWPADVHLMREAGLTVARMGEFAWSTIEPAKGELHLDWLERAVSALAAAGIVSVLGTPSASPPPWLVDEHPDILPVDIQGRRAQVGGRGHYCVNSPEYHAATRRIVEAMAKRFGENPHVIGWQVDNEFGRACYCDRCRELFQQYLAAEYGAIDALERHWTSRYWSQTYSAWKQIPLPRGSHDHPGLMISFTRFVTTSFRRFLQLQIDALRPHLPDDVWITHNFSGRYHRYDHHALSEALDLVSWDWYVGSGHNDHLLSGLENDVVRGLKKRNYWIMETQPGSASWAKTAVNSTLDRGEARAMAWHAVAHGADAVLYWQWRSPLNGQEQYHGTLIDQSGRPRPFYEEVWQLGREFAAASPLLAGSAVPQGRVALVHSHESRWSIGWQAHTPDFDYGRHMAHYYRPLAARNTPIDVISAEAPPDDYRGYRLVVAPALHIVRQEQAAALEAFVEKGGYLIVTLRSGMKDRHNALLPVRQPGPLTDLAGAEVEEYYALEEPVPVKGKLFSGTCHTWAERLRVLDKENTLVVAAYGRSNGWLDDQPAITVRPHGRGYVYLVGAYLNDDSQDAFLTHVVRLAGVARPPLKVPEGVEARVRTTPDGSRTYIVINHTREEQTIRLPWPAREHLSGQPLSGRFKLEPYGVALLTREEQ